MLKSIVFGAFSLENDEKGEFTKPSGWGLVNLSGCPCRNFSRVQIKVQSSWRHLELGNGKWGGKTHRAIWGTIESALQHQIWRPQKVGLVWSVPVSSKDNDTAWTNGGKRFIGGGVQNRFWEGMVCFPHPLIFSAPFAAL